APAKERVGPAGPAGSGGARREEYGGGGGSREGRAKGGVAGSDASCGRGGNGAGRRCSGREHAGNDPHGWGGCTPWTSRRAARCAGGAAAHPTGAGGGTGNAPCRGAGRSGSPRSR